MDPIPARVLTIAGSDSGGGAGIQADLKTFAAHGAYGLSVITAVTAQNTRGVRAVHVVPPAVVADQVDAVFDDVEIDAVKIGMLANRAIVEAVTVRLAVHRPTHLVIDPVMVATSGDVLLDDEAEAALEVLLPMATVVTPNGPEAERLAGAPSDCAPSDCTTSGLPSDDDEPARSRRAEQLRARWSQDGTGPAVLVKGGHAGSANEPMVDLLATDEGITRFVHARLDTRATHGTGCTLSAAIACRLACGDAVPVAVGGAIDYVHQAMRHAFPVGGGHGPVNHLYGWRSS